MEDIDDTIDNIEREIKSGKTQEAVVLMEKHDTDLKKNNNQGYSALVWAAAGKGDTAILQFLIKKGVNVVCENTYKQTLLWLACQSGNHEAVLLLLNNGAGKQVNEEAFPTRSTPLMEAIKKGDEKSVGFLIDKGADPLIGDCVKFARQTGKKDIADLMVRMGAQDTSEKKEEFVLKKDYIQEPSHNSKDEKKDQASKEEEQQDQKISYPKVQQMLEELHKQRRDSAKKDESSSDEELLKGFDDIISITELGLEERRALVEKSKILKPDEEEQNNYTELLGDDEVGS